MSSIPSLISTIWRDLVKREQPAVKLDRDIDRIVVEPPPTQLPPLYRPFILMRFTADGVDRPAETRDQFFKYGWRHGVEINALEQIDLQLEASLPGRVASRITTWNASIPGAGMVQATSLIEDASRDYVGDRVIYLYLPWDEYTPYGGLPTSPICGGPSEDGLRLLHTLAVHLHLKIAVIESDHRGGLFCMFKTHDPTMTLDGLAQVWKQLER